MDVKEFMNDRPHVLVTNHGGPICSVKLDGKNFPVLAAKWEVPRGRELPVVTLSFYARLEVTGFEKKIDNEFIEGILQEVIGKHPQASVKNYKIECVNTEMDGWVLDVTLFVPGKADNLFFKVEFDGFLAKQNPGALAAMIATQLTKVLE